MVVIINYNNRSVIHNRINSVFIKYCNGNCMLFYKKKPIIAQNLTHFLPSNTESSSKLPEHIFIYNLTTMTDNN